MAKVSCIKTNLVCFLFSMATTSTPKPTPKHFNRDMPNTTTVLIDCFKYGSILGNYVGPSSLIWILSTQKVGDKHTTATHLKCNPINAHGELCDVY